MNSLTSINFSQVAHKTYEVSSQALVVAKAQVSSTAQSVFQSVKPVIEQTYQNVRNYEYAKTAKNWTEMAKQAYPVIKQEAIEALPYIVAEVLLPAPLFLAALITLFAVKTLYARNTKTEPDVKNMNNGLGFYSAACGLYSLYRGISRFSPNRILTSAIELAVASWLFDKSGLIKRATEKVNAQPQPVAVEMKPVTELSA